MARARGGIAKKLFLAISGLVLLAVVALALLVGPALYDFWKAGFLARAPERKYSGNDADNLRALHTALMLYHDSEGMFPHGEGWMDAIESRLRAGDMKKEESEKKLVHPLFWPPDGRRFGYAFNDSCSGKYIDDIPHPDTTPLVFDSKDLSRNAHGDPKVLLPDPPRGGRNLGISVSGKLMQF